MRFELPRIVEDKAVPLNTLIILNPRYKLEQSKDDPMVWEEVLDMEATAKASVVIKNIGAVE